MILEELKSKVNEFVKNNKLTDGFNLLSKTISSHSEISKNFIVLQSQLTRANQEYDLGTLSYDNYNVAVNKLSRSTLNFLENLTDSDLTKPDKTLAEHSILILCRNSKDELYMHNFCGRMRLDNYRIEQIEDYIEPTNCDFILLDNHSLGDLEHQSKWTKEDKHFLKQMEYYIKNYDDHEKYMIHFGETWDIVSNYRDVVYAANSKFALYSRIQEMVQFIKHDRLYKKTHENS